MVVCLRVSEYVYKVLLAVYTYSLYVPRAAVPEARVLVHQIYRVRNDIASHLTDSPASPIHTQPSNTPVTLGQKSDLDARAAVTGNKEGP